MQVTVNVVSLPPVVVDAFLDILKASITPILAEELPAKAQKRLLDHAYHASCKSVCMRFMTELDEAGLFNAVSIDYPSFKWGRGTKFCYAVDVITPCLVKTMAEEMVTGRDVSEFVDFLEAWNTITIDKVTGDLLEDIEGPVARRLEEHALGLAQGNYNLMIGETPHMMLKLLGNVSRALANGSHTPLDCLEHDMEYLVPNLVVYL